MDLSSGEWERFGGGKGATSCEHVCSLAVLLEECLRGKDKFVLALDGIDQQREAPQTLLAALARLGEVVRFFSLFLFS